MGMLTEAGTTRQVAKGQGETNAKFDTLIAAQNRTNQLLEWIGTMVQAHGTPDATKAPDA